MIGKIVLTEKGVKLSNELFILNPDDPPPFFEEGKPIQKQVSSPKIANLFEKSNGFLDRVTLKSAQSNRKPNINKPFFLPNYEYQEVYEVCPSTKTSKYPGIYPPLPRTSQGSRRERLSQPMQQIPSSHSLKQGGTFQKEGTGQLTGLLMTGSHPLILDYETLSKQQNDQQNYRTQKSSHLQQIFLKNQNQGQDDGAFPLFDPIGGANKRSLPGLQNPKSHQLIGTHQQITHQEESPKKNALNRFQYGISTKIDELFKGTMTSSNKYALTAFQQGQRKPINREQYEKSIKDRMDLKKQTYLYHREIQDKRLKEIAQKRSDLSKEPVHIAAKYLAELKKEDPIVENLMYDVNYFKTRYKNRLSEYHNQKYKKKWNNFYFPSEKKPDSSPKREIKQDLEEDFLDLDLSSHKPSMKSFQKQNSLTSYNNNNNNIQ